MNKESRKIGTGSESGNHEAKIETNCQSGSDFLGSWLPD
jgi:hypothetical protein